MEISVEDLFWVNLCILEAIVIMEKVFWESY